MNLIGNAAIQNLRLAFPFPNNPRHSPSHEHGRARSRGPHVVRDETEDRVRRVYSRTASEVAMRGAGGANDLNMAGVAT